MTLDQMRSHQFMSKVSIPTSLPHYSMNFPPKFQFYRKYQLETKNIQNANELSQLNDSAEYKKYLNDILTFAHNNLKEVKCNKVNENILFSNKNKINNNSLNINQNNQKLNISFTKENHSLLKNKKKGVDLKQYCYIEELVDYNSKFGIMYMTNNRIIGINFKDKTIIYKVLKKPEFEFENKKIKMKKSFNSNELKDVPTEIRSKLNLLQNYEKYILADNNNALPLNSTNKKLVYVKKIITTDISYILKLSNNVIQVF